MTDKTTSDRELLEMAAKAVGWVKWKVGNNDWFYVSAISNWNEQFAEWELWNPLTDDGDEARLEAALDLWVSWYPAMVLVGPEVSGHITGDACAEYYDQHNGSKQAARRLAGVRAAAAIGAAK